MSLFFGDIFSEYQFGFRRGHSWQQRLLQWFKIGKKSVDKSRKSETLLIHLSKTFACRYHDLLTAKLHACELEKNVLKLFYSYLKERKQRVKIDNVYGEWEEVLFGLS